MRTSAAVLFGTLAAILSTTIPVHAGPSRAGVTADQVNEKLEELVAEENNNNNNSNNNNNNNNNNDNQGGGGGRSEKRVRGMGSSTSGTRLGDVIPVGVRVEEDGWEFEISAEVGAESLSKIARTKARTLLRPKRRFASEEQRIAEESELLLGLSADKFSVRFADSLPSSFDFFDKYPRCLPEPRDQRECGGCWAFAATSAASARLCARMVERGWDEAFSDGFSLSAQKLISCAAEDVAPSGNGCLGAYSEDGAMLLSKLAVPEERCFPFASGDGDARRGQCDSEESLRCRPTWRTGKVRRFHAVHDRTARVAAIKKEILENGPVTAIMRTPASFVGYNGRGVYSKTGPWLSDPDLGEYAFHSVVLVGWGSSPVEHFVGLNSWGNAHPRFGGAGRGAFFRIAAPAPGGSGVWNGFGDTGDDASCWITDIEILSVDVSSSVAGERCHNLYDRADCTTAQTCEFNGQAWTEEKGNCRDPGAVCCSPEIKELRRRAAEDEHYANLRYRRRSRESRGSSSSSSSSSACPSRHRDGECMSEGKCHRTRKGFSRGLCPGNHVCCTRDIRRK